MTLSNRTYAHKKRRHRQVDAKLGGQASHWNHDEASKLVKVDPVGQTPLVAWTPQSYTAQHRLELVWALFILEPELLAIDVVSIIAV